MESFEIRIGAKQKKLRIEPQALSSNATTTSQFKIFAADKNSDWVAESLSDEEDIPASDFLGTITIKNERDFIFEGEGTFSGDNLLGIAAQIVLHPSFKG